MNKTVPLNHRCELRVEGGVFCGNHRVPGERFCSMHLAMLNRAARWKRTEERTRRWLDSWVQRVRDKDSG